MCLHLPLGVETGQGVGNMLVLSLALLVGWLEVSYLFIKVQLLSASIATKYYYI